MRRAHFRLGIRTGLVVAAASAGVLIAFGMGIGQPFAAFSVPMRVDGTAPMAVIRLLSVLAGVVVLTAYSVIWATLFAAAASRVQRRRWAVVAAAIGFAAVMYVVNHALLPGVLRPTYDGFLTKGQNIVLYLTIAAALVLGIRLALLPRA